MVGGHPVDTGDHTRPGAAAAAVEHTHAVQGRPFGDTVSCSADRSGNVRAVPLTIIRCGVIVNEVVPCPNTSAELCMRAANASIQNIDMDVGPVPNRGIAVVQRQHTLVDAIQSPRRVGLRVGNADNLILLDPRNIGVLAEGLHCLVRQGRSKALQCAAVDKVNVGTKHCCGLHSFAADGVSTVDTIASQHDDVLVGNPLTRCRHVDRGRFVVGLTLLQWVDEIIGVQRACDVVGDQRRCKKQTQRTEQSDPKQSG